MGRNKRKRRKAAELAARAGAAQAGEQAGETPTAMRAPPRTSSADEGPVEDLDVDLPEAQASESYESLVAEVAGLPDEPREGGARTAGSPDDGDVVSVENTPEVIDLDDEEGSPGTVNRLIAQAGVSAPVEEEGPEEEVSVIDLDAGAATGRAPARPGYVPGPSAATAARLVEAAAAGAVDDAPALSLDLGEVSTPEARARLLAEALAHAEHKEARYRVPLTDAGQAARWKSLVASVLFVLAGSVAVAPPEWVRPEPPAQLSDAARARGVRLALLLQAQQVEAFRLRWLRLPDTLAELPASLPGLRYTRSGNRAYQLIGYQRDGSAIVYDSADPAPAFRALMGVWAAAP